MSRGYAAIGLFKPKSPLNVGSVLRAAGCYDAKLVISCGLRYKRSATDTQKAYKHIPFMENVDNLMDNIPYDCVPIAIDLLDGAKSLVDFKHPERAFYIFGPEDGTLGKQVTDRCKHTVYVPTRYCMNLAATVNVILYDRMVKNDSQ